MREKPKTKAGKAAKVGKVMGEYKHGQLKSGSGQKVTSRAQAVAIAMHEAGIPMRHPHTRRPERKG